MPNDNPDEKRELYKNHKIVIRAEAKLHRAGKGNMRGGESWHAYIDGDEVTYRIHRFIGTTPDELMTQCKDLIEEDEKQMHEILADIDDV